MKEHIWVGLFLSMGGLAAIGLFSVIALLYAPADAVISALYFALFCIGIVAGALFARITGRRL